MRKGRGNQNNPQEKVVATCEKKSWRPKQPARKSRCCCLHAPPFVVVDLTVLRCFILGWQKLRHITRHRKTLLFNATDPAIKFFGSTLCCCSLCVLGVKICTTTWRNANSVSSRDEKTHGQSIVRRQVNDRWSTTTKRRTTWFLLHKQTTIAST